jgi:hypothetical protein
MGDLELDQPGVQTVRSPVDQSDDPVTAQPDDQAVDQPDDQPDDQKDVHK